MESITNIRTVSSLGHYNIIFDKFSDKVKNSYNSQIEKIIIVGFFWGLAHFMLFLAFGITFYIRTIII